MKIVKIEHLEFELEHVDGQDCILADSTLLALVRDRSAEALAWQLTAGAKLRILLNQESPDPAEVEAARTNLAMAKQACIVAERLTDELSEGEYIAHNRLAGALAGVRL